MKDINVEVTNNELEASKNFRNNWEQKNPDKFIRIDEYLKTTPELLIAKCTWSTNCSNKELINYVDNSINNLDGRVEQVKENADGTESGIVVVYLVEIKDVVDNFLRDISNCCINTYDSDILHSGVSPIAVAVYIACVENNDCGLITDERIHLATHWNAIDISRGFAELQKHGYLQKTGWQRFDDDKDLFAFRKSLNQNFIDTDVFIDKGYISFY